MKKIFTAILLFCLLTGTIFVFSAPASEAMLEQGMEALRSGNYSSAELIFRRLTSSNEEEIKDRAWFYLAQSIFYQKNYKSSIHEFTSYLNKCRTTALCQESRFWIAESYYYLKEYNNAIEEYKRYIDRNNSQIMVENARDKIGTIYFDQRRYDEAIIEWEKAISLSSDQNANAMRILNIGRALHLNNKFDEALDRLAPLLTSKADPKIIASARIISGRIYQTNGNHSRALTLFNNIPENMLKTSPYSEARYYKALSLIALGDTANAKSQLQIYIAIAKEDALRYNALYELGMLSIKTKETERGLEQLNEVRQNGSLELKQLTNKFLGIYYMDSNPTLALTYLEESKKLTKDDRDITLSLAKAYISNNRLDEAKKLLLQYQDKYPYDPNVDQVHFYLAQIHLERKETQEALKLFESIKQNNPFSEYIDEADLYIARASFDSGDYQKTVNLLNDYLRKKNTQNKYEATRLMASSYIAMNNINTAKTYVNQIINNYISRPKADEIIFRFAVASEERGINASWYTNTLISRFPESESTYLLYLFLGDQAFKSSKYIVAIDYYDKYLKSGRKESRGTAFYNKILSMFNAKKYNEIIAILKSDSIPPLDEDQWVNIPFVLARCYNSTGEQDKIYSMFSSQDTKTMPEDVLFMFLQSAIIFGDIQLAQSNLERLSSNQVTRAEILYSVASYYKSNSDNNTALKYYQTIMSECPGTPKADYAVYEYAKILYARGNNAEAITNLNTIKDKALTTQKNLLLILCYFNTGDNNNAVLLTNREINNLAKYEEGEQVLKRNLLYYYQQKNTTQFNSFTYYLQTWYKHTAPYVNYISGKYYYELKNYSSSFAYFSKIADLEHEFKIETWFYLGEINLLFNKKPQVASQFFNRVIENDKNSDFGYKSRLEMALILRENAKYEEATHLLTTIINEKAAKPTYVIQAENIYSAIQDDIRNVKNN